MPTKIAEQYIILTDKEKNLLEMIKSIDYGEMRVIIQDKQPVRIEELKKSIKL